MTNTKQTKNLLALGSLVILGACQVAPAQTNINGSAVAPAFGIESGKLCIPMNNIYKCHTGKYTVKGHAAIMCESEVDDFSKLDQNAFAALVVNQLAGLNYDVRQDLSYNDLLSAPMPDTKTSLYNSAHDFNIIADETNKYSEDNGVTYLHSNASVLLLTNGPAQDIQLCKNQ